MALQSVHILISGSSEYVTLHDLQDFGGVTQLRIWKQGEYSSYPGGPDAIRVSF